MTDMLAPTASLWLSVILLGLSVGLAWLSVTARLPWAMVGGLTATSLMSLALIVDAAGPAGIDICCHALNTTSMVLRFMAVIVLAASGWTFYSQRRKAS